MLLGGTEPALAEDAPAAPQVSALALTGPPRLAGAQVSGLDVSVHLTDPMGVTVGRSFFEVNTPSSSPVGRPTGRCCCSARGRPLAHGVHELRDVHADVVHVPRLCVPPRGAWAYRVVGMKDITRGTTAAYGRPFLLTGH